MELFGHYYHFNSMDLAVFFLTALAGWAIVNVFSAGCFRYVLALAIVGVLVIALLKGESSMLENITYNLSRYFAREPVGLIGLISGIVLGLIVRRRRR